MSLEFEPIALSPAAAADYLSISKRTLYNLIADGKLIARKLPGGKHARLLVDVASIKAYYNSLPIKDGAEALFPVRQ
jgi:excisionase family DNA binding protein